MPEIRPPDVDLVIAFRTTKALSLSKQQTKEDARKAEQQYNRLLQSLSYAGLKAVGRRGEQLGHILVFVVCPPKLVGELVKRERHSDFLSGLPVTPAPNVLPLSPADRIRLVHSFITSTPSDGGLGISPDAPEWDLIESIFPLHDRNFNELWIRAWKPRNIASVQLERIRDQFGDALAYYFAFLASYTRFLAVPAALGAGAHFLLPAYSPIYSVLLSIWSIVFVEWWRVQERILSLKFSTRGSFKVEKCRAQHKPGMAWWSRELRVFASIPVIIFWAGLLTAILTGIFVFEAFITHLYEGPGKKFLSFSPTIFFVVLLPKFLGAYHSIAVRLTNWENHRHKSSYNASLTLKTFALGAIVAYLGLALSAFVYVPFGEGVMRWVQAWLFGGARAQGSFAAAISDILNGTITTTKPELHHLRDISEKVADVYSGLWDPDTANVRAKLNPSRLRDQMFAYTVTNQVIGTFLEIGLPFILRWVDGLKKKKDVSAASTKAVVSPLSTTPPNGSDAGSSNGTPKKRVVFEDEKERGGMEERAFLDMVRAEAALPEYDLFVDLNEMVVQFGYVTLWSTIWPLAGAMAFLNNLLELRSDAFKMTVHHRRPIPTRTDTIGPWLEALTFLTWLGALSNAALVYLFSPQLLPSGTHGALTSSNASANAAAASFTGSKQVVEEHLASAAGAVPNGGWGVDSSASSATFSATADLLLKAALIALLASHGFILLRLFIRHVVDKVCWKGSAELEEKEMEIRRVREGELKGTNGGSASKIGADKVVIEREVMSHDSAAGLDENGERKDSMHFWEHDEGVEEIQRISKEA
ncbi:calcium-activated chloride channel-domain-containing protein [Crepidotus variabilis]|uniref:Calcium-activated chloride channel-domain-containing protein n=1 Tax=Crepidotus variabilis TaxID=179855 RepID=A0A9P6JQH0_9AGAR|nr:calcium-activated chloride channel-domain-containing protein [Crepidotus variabilis]